AKAESCEPMKRRDQTLYRRTTKTSRRPKSKDQWLRVRLPKELLIIPRPIWLRVQNRIDNNQKWSPRNAHNFYTLQGHLRCAYCNGAYSATFCDHKTRKYFYYRCWRRCEQSRWTSRDVLDSIIWGEVRRALLNPRKFIKRVK